MKNQLPILADTLTRQRYIEIGALQVGGHFVYSGGGHSDEFFDFEAVVPNWQDIGFFYLNILKEITKQKFRIDTVIGPERGGIALAHMMAYLLEKTGGLCHGIYAEKIRDAKERQIVGCRYRIPPVFSRYITGSMVLALDDVANTGGNLAEVVSLTRSAGAKEVIATVMVDRCGLTAEQISADHLIAVVKMPNKVWYADCPMCDAGIPINTEFGHSAEFLASRAGK